MPMARPRHPRLLHRPRLPALVLLMAASALLGGCATTLSPATFSTWQIERQPDESTVLFRGIPVRTGQIVASEQGSPQSIFLSLLVADNYPFVHTGILAVEDGVPMLYEANGKIQPALGGGPPTRHIGGGLRRVTLRASSRDSASLPSTTHRLARIDSASAGLPGKAWPPACLSIPTSTGRIRRRSTARNLRRSPWLRAASARAGRHSSIPMNLSASSWTGSKSRPRTSSLQARSSQTARESLSSAACTLRRKSQPTSTSRLNCTGGSRRIRNWAISSASQRSAA